MTENNRRSASSVDPDVRPNGVGRTPIGSDSHELESIKRDLQESRDSFRALYESAGDAVFMIRDGVFVDCNARTLKIFGCTKQEILGRGPHRFSPPRQPDGTESRDAARQWMDEARRQGKVTFPWQHCRYDGTMFPAEVTVTAVQLHGETQLLGLVRDMSHANGELNLNTGPALHLSQSQKLESLGLMAGGIAHDFNNLLLAIMGNADLLDQDLSHGRDGRPLLDEIRKAAGRAADLCNQLLAYAGKGHFNVHPLDLSTTTREMVQMIKVAVSRKVTLRLDLAEDLPLIEADVSKIHQIIMNLVVNASESMGTDPGVVSLRTGRRDCETERFDHCLLVDSVPAGDLVYLEVQDTGQGMNESTLQRIFDPFFSTKINGRGLGLASVLGIIRGHQGSLCVRSKQGEGTCFRVCFPVGPVGTRTVPKPTGRIAERRTGGTILVVDDEEYLRILCARMLQRLGYEVIMASDGLQALDIYQQQGADIDCVMLDLSMPVLDGVEVFEKLSDMDRNVRVVMTSGYHEQEIATRFAGRGLSGFIQKPYVVADLDDVVGRVLSEDFQPDRLDPPPEES